MKTNNFSIQNVSVMNGQEKVVSGVSLTINPGELHVLMGPNGSGKSSFLGGLFGHPRHTISEGNIFFLGEDITALPTYKKARKGLFLSLQHPPAVEGVTLGSILYQSYREQGGEKNILDFYAEIEGRLKAFGIDTLFLKKDMNSGLSGGEKKLSEIIQMIALKPSFAFLDEIDSGVDVDALKIISEAIRQAQKEGTGILVVSHYSSLLSHIIPDHVHVMKKGSIVKSGGKELAKEISERGFETL